MMPFGNSWEWWLLSLLILRGLYSLGIFIAKRRSMSIDRDEVLQAREETLKRATKAAVFGMACFIGGWFAHQSAENRARYAYTDVLILARHDDRRFTIQPARMQPFDTKPLCTSEDWQKFEKMKLFIFTPKDGCWDVERGGEYRFYMQNGKRILYPQETLTDARY